MKNPARLLAVLAITWAAAGQVAAAPAAARRFVPADPRFVEAITEDILGEAARG